jgi:hypothetical protein
LLRSVGVATGVPAIVTLLLGAAEAGPIVALSSAPMIDAAKTARVVSLRIVYPSRQLFGKGGWPVPAERLARSESERKTYGYLFREMANDTDDVLAALRAVKEQRQDNEASERREVLRARGLGLSWRVIADALGREVSGVFEKHRDAI